MHLAQQPNKNEASSRIALLLLALAMRRVRGLADAEDAAIVEAVAKALRPTNAFGITVLEWEGDPLADGLPLRTAAALRSLRSSAQNLSFCLFPPWRSYT